MPSESMMAEICCEICGWEYAPKWLVPCKNSDRCGQGRHFFCMDNVKVPSTPPADLASFPALECAVCFSTSAQGYSGKKRTAAAAASGSKRAAQRGSKAAPGSAAGTQAAPPKQAAAAAPGPRPVEPAIDAEPYGQDNAFGPAGSVFAQSKAQQDLAVGADGNALFGSTGGDVGRGDLGRSRSASGQLEQGASGTCVPGSELSREFRPAAAATAAATGQRPRMSSYDFSFVDVDPVRSAGSAPAAGAGPNAAQGSTGSAGQQPAAAAAAAAAGSAAEACVSDDDEDDDRPLKRIKPQAGSKTTKAPAALASTNRPSAAVHDPELQHQQQQEAPSQAASTAAGKDPRAAARPAAACAATVPGAGTAVHGEGLRAGKPGGLIDKYKGQLKNHGRCTQLTDRPPPDVLQRGRKKPAAAAATGAAGAVAAAGANPLPTAATGRATAAAEKPPLDPMFSAFDDLNSPAVKGASAGPSARLKAAGKPAGNPALATAASTGAAAGTTAGGKPAHLPIPGHGVVNGSSRPPLPPGSSGGNGTSHAAAGRVASGFGGGGPSMSGAVPGGTSGLNGRVPSRPAVGFRAAGGVVPAARRQMPIFDISKALGGSGSLKSSGSIGAGPPSASSALAGPGSHQGVLETLNSQPTVDAALAEADNAAEVLDNKESWRKDSRGQRVKLWECVVPLRFDTATLQKGEPKGLMYVMEAISPHESMVRLCDKLQSSCKQPGYCNWRLMQGGDVPATIKDTREFYMQNAPCETCLVFYPQKLLGGVYPIFIDLLGKLKGTDQFLAVELPLITPEELAREPVLARLLNALPPKGGGGGDSHTVPGGPYRLYFVPHQVPIDGVNFDNGIWDCLLCLTGSRKHIHLMSIWEPTPAAERGVKGIIQLTKNSAPKRKVIFDYLDKNKHMEARLLREKEGHALREKPTKDPTSVAGRADAAGEASEAASEVDREPRDTGASAADASKAASDANIAGGDTGMAAGGASKVAGGASRPAGGASRLAGDTSRPEGDTSRPEGDISKAAGDITKPAGDTSRVTGDASKPAGDASRVTGSIAKLAVDTSRAAGDIIKPAGDTSRTAGDTSRATVDASRATVDASRATVDASKAAGDTSRAAGDAGKAAGDTSRATGDAVKAVVDNCKAAVDTGKVAGDICKAAGDTCRMAGDTSKAAVDAGSAAGITGEQAGDTHMAAGSSATQARPGSLDVATVATAKPACGQATAMGPSLRTSHTAVTISSGEDHGDTASAVAEAEVAEKLNSDVDMDISPLVPVRSGTAWRRHEAAMAAVELTHTASPNVVAAASQSSTWQLQAAGSLAPVVQQSSAGPAVEAQKAEGELASVSTLFQLPGPAPVVMWSEATIAEPEVPAMAARVTVPVGAPAIAAASVGLPVMASEVVAQEPAVHTPLATAYTNCGTDLSVVAPAPAINTLVGTTLAGAAAAVTGAMAPSSEVVSWDNDAYTVDAPGESAFSLVFTWSVVAAGVVAERQACAAASSDAGLAFTASLGSSVDKSKMDPMEQPLHPTLDHKVSDASAILQTFGSTTSSPEGNMVNPGFRVGIPQAPAGKGDWHEDGDELLPTAASNHPIEDSGQQQPQHQGKQGQHHFCQQKLEHQHEHAQQAVKMQVENEEDAGQQQQWPPAVLVPVVEEDVPMDVDSPSGGSAAAFRHAGENNREEGSESSAATALNGLGESPEEEEGAVAEEPETCGPDGMAGQVLLDWRTLVPYTACSMLGWMAAGVPEQAETPLPCGKLVSWRDLVPYGSCGGLPAAPEGPLVPQQELVQHHHASPQLVQEQAAHMVVSAALHAISASGGAGTAAAVSGPAGCKWSWAKPSMPVLQAASLKQLGIPYRELQCQLPYLMSDLQRVSHMPLRGCQLRLAAKPTEAAGLEAALDKAAQEFGFSWASWSLDAAPNDLDGIQVLLLSESVVKEDVSKNKALIIKSIAVHPVQLYRAEPLVSGLQLLAQQMRDLKGGGPPHGPSLEAALHLAHSEGEALAEDCQPLYPLRVVVVMDAQGFLKTPKQLLKSLTGCLLAGSRAWGEPWQLQMRAADIAMVQRQGSPEHHAALASALDPAGAAAEDDGTGGFLPKAEGQAPPPEQQPQQPVLVPLGATMESSKKDMLVIRDAARLMHLARPGRLVMAAYADDEGKDYPEQGRRSKDILAGTVTEVVCFLDLLLKNSWQEGGFGKEGGFGGHIVG